MVDGLWCTLTSYLDFSAAKTCYLKMKVLKLTDCNMPVPKVHFPLIFFVHESAIAHS